MDDKVLRLAKFMGYVHPSGGYIDISADDILELAKQILLFLEKEDKNE